MKLGINQVLLLRWCLKKGSINFYDVKMVYNLPISRMKYATSNKKANIILEKMEIRNLVSKTSDELPLTWVLTEHGEEMLQENLGGFIKNGKSG